MAESREKSTRPRPVRTVEHSRTEQVHLIMQKHLNSAGRLFGGILMQWVDEVATVVAMRHAGTRNVTTAAIDNLQFKEATYEGEMLVLIGYVTHVGNSSIEVEVDTYVERINGMRYSVNRAFFVMVAMDENEHPIQVPALEVQTEAERARSEAGAKRKAMRNERYHRGY